MRENLYIFNSKMKILIHIVTAFLLITGFAVFTKYIGTEYAAAAQKNKINEWSRQRFLDFYAEPKNSIDILFVGSSHSYCSFDPEIIDAMLGTSSFQLGMPQQQPDSTYYTLLDALLHQKPKYVVMELYWDMLVKDFEIKQVDTLFQVMDNDRLKREYINSGFALNQRIKYYIKPIRFQQDFLQYQNSNLEKYLKEKYNLSKEQQQYEGEEYYRSKGFIFCDYIMTKQDRQKVIDSPVILGNDWKMSAVQKKYIMKIIELCRKEEIKLIFVTAPVSNILFDHIIDYEYIHNTLAGMAKQHNIPYYDFNISDNFNDNEFRDKGHLNYEGAKKAGAVFARRIMEGL